MAIEVKKLDPNEYAGLTCKAAWTSDRYYDIYRTSGGYIFQLGHMDPPREYRMKHDLFSSDVEEPIVYGAFEDEELIGFAEGGWEKEKNRFCLARIAVLNPKRRCEGTGMKLFHAIREEAKESGARMLYLKTRTSNLTAIRFFRELGLSIIGFDPEAIADEPRKKPEARLWMGFMLVRTEETD